jgi:hypothetical protein
MILHAPVASGRDNIAQEIISCGNDRKLSDLASTISFVAVSTCRYTHRMRK